MEYYIPAVIFLLYGLIVGSFLNVCIYRLPKGMGIVKGRSMCPACNHVLGAGDLVPIFSYVFLGRKCRYCKERISPRYAGIEILTGVLFTIIYWRFGWSIQGVLACVLGSALVVIAWIDIDVKEIPDRLHIFIFILAICNLFVDTETGITLKVIGFFAISLPMLLFAYVTNGFGGADIKLMAVTGLYLGAISILVAFFLGALLGAIYGIYIVIKQGANGKTAFAFCPSLCIGILLSVLFGNQIIEFYVSFF